MAKQIIGAADGTIQAVAGTGVGKAQIGRFVKFDSTAATPALPIDYPVSAILPTSGDGPAELAGVLLEVTTQGLRLGQKGVYRIRKASSLTGVVGQGIATVNAAGEVLTTTDAGHGLVLLVDGDWLYIQINLPR